jgi:hypothetical protein
LLEQFSKLLLLLGSQDRLELRPRLLRQLPALLVNLLRIAIRLFANLLEFVAGIVKRLPDLRSLILRQIEFVERLVEALEHPAMPLLAALRLLRRIAWQDAVYLGARAVGRRAGWMPALREASRLRGRLRAHREVCAVRPVLPAVMGEEVS